MRSLCEIKLIWESFGHLIPLQTACLEVSSCVWQQAALTVKGSALQAGATQRAVVSPRPAYTGGCFLEAIAGGGGAPRKGGSPGTHLP